MYLKPDFSHTRVKHAKNKMPPLKKQTKKLVINQSK